MSPERERLLRALEMQSREERRKTVRPVLLHGRRTEAATDPNQLPVKETIYLRDPASGEMFFTLGYSLIDGPDVVAE